MEIRAGSFLGRDAVRELDPGAFAVVMATGIVAADMRGQHVAVLADALLAVAVACYLVLLAGTAWRLAAFPARLRADLGDPLRGFGSFTFVAATDVLGTLLVAPGRVTVAVVLLAVGTLSWLLLGYAVPLLVLSRRADRPVVHAANGSWFLWVVGVQSVAVLAAAVEPNVRSGRPELGLLAVACWSVGVVLYGGVAVVVAARLVLGPPGAVELTPQYWIGTGATAITAVSGAGIAGMSGSPAVAAARGLVAAVSIVLLAFGTWLIPLLLAAGWWRHVRHRVPLRYVSGWWSIVFPVGMYSAAATDLGSAVPLPLLHALGGFTSWLALAAWLAAATAACVTLVRRLAVTTGPSQESPPSAHPG